MNTTKVLVLLVVLLFVAQVSADNSDSSQQKTIPTSNVGDIIKGVTYKVDQGRSFHMVQVPTLQKKYLFFSMTTDPIYKHLNISLSIIKQSSQTPLYRCLKEELDSCYIPKDKITENETLFLVVESGEDECEYQIKSYWSDLEHIEVNTEIKFMFSKEQQRQIYHLELEGKQFEELRIIIKPETRRYAFDRIKMYGSFGTESDPSSQQYDFKSVHLWEDAEGIYLSRKELKQLKLNLILYGEIETVYTLQCTLVNKTHNDLAIDTKIYEYLEKNQDQEYHISYKNTTGQIAYDSFVFRVAIFTGDLSLEYYADKAKTKRITSREPFMYMGDIQYVISKEEIQKEFPEGFYIKAISKDRVSTFMMEFEGRSKSSALELHEHIYEFLPVVKKEVSYFKIARFQEQNKMKKQPLKVIFSVIPVIGKVAIEFRKCTKSLQECTDERYIVNSAVIKSEYRELGSKQIYTLQLDDDFWQYVNIVEKNAVIVVALTNVEKIDSFAAIEYNVGNRPEYLRENKPIESHVRKDELKIYKYVNEDPSIKKVRVHINKISGCFNSYYFRHEPSEEELKLDNSKITNSVLQVTENLTKEPIVIIVRGEDSATYSIVVQPIHEDENYINSITLSEDVEFKIKIGPNKYEIFEISPINAQIFFKYRSTGAVHICTLDKDNKCTDTSAIFTNNGEISHERFIDRSQFIKLRNPSSTKSIEVVSIFHSKKDNHCEIRKLGQLYKEVITEGSCYSTIIHESKNFDVFIGREEAGQLGYSLFICDRILTFDMKNQGEQRYRITSDQINVSCKQHSEIVFSFVAVSRANDPTQKQAGPEKIHLKYLVQYTDDRVILPDGVGYHGIAVSTESSLKIFTYQIVNNIETTIVLTTAKKLFFLVKIIDSVNRDTTVITSNDYHLTSPAENFYFLDSIYLKVTPQDITKSKCKNCELLIYVYSKEDIGQQVDYTIEVTQNFVMLEDGVHKQGYLLGNSKAFYGFTTKKEGTLVIEVTDNNRNCAEIYLSGTEYPDENKYLEKSFDGQLIRYNSYKEEKTSYISVRARQTCAYSIAATLVEGKESIMKLQRGVLGYSNLKEGQVKYFTFKHLSQNPFKIISLHKYGHVEFYLNKSTPQEVTDLIRVNKINHEDFTFHSNHKNRLYLDSKSKQFCKGCFYILAVKAIKHTESSIFLGDEDTKIPLNEQKVLNDILLKENSFTKADFYFMKSGTIEVKVHSGKIQVQIQYKDQSFKKVFEKSSAPVLYNFTLNEVKGYYGPAFGVFKALAENTVYSLRIRPTTSAEEDVSDTHIVHVNPSEPNYIYLVHGKLNCLKGFLKRADERLFLSYALKDRDVAEEMKIVGKIDGNWTKISQDVTRNVISITFLDLLGSDMTRAKPYELCLSHDNVSITVTAVQSEETSLLPQNFEMLVVNEQNYDIYPEGDFMLDVFECRGKAKIAYGSSRSALKDSKPKVLDMIGMPDQSHAIRVQSGYINVLLGVSGQLSLIRWLPIKQQEERGLGYYLYNAGSLKYDTSFGVIDVIVEPVKKVKKTKTKIVEITYNLYVSNNEDELKEASLCERYFPESVLDFKVIHQSLAESPFKFTIDKAKFSEKYAKEDNVFITIVADLVIQTPDETNEQYRFVYKNQQIPAEIFMPTQLESTKLPILISFLLVFIAAVLVFAWCCTRVIVPMIGRLRNRMLVEEEGGDLSKDKKDVNDDQLEPPPSSDRQAMQFDKPPVETQVKMG